MRRAAILGACVAMAACGGAGRDVCPQVPGAGATSPNPSPNPNPNLSPSPSPSPSPNPTPGPGPTLSLLIRPLTQPHPLVHVEIDFASLPRLPGSIAIRREAVVANATARDATGELPVTVQRKGDGVALNLPREPQGSLHLAYDVEANREAPDDPLGVLVQDDRFRAAGEELVAFPAGVEDVPMSFTLRIDGEALRAPVAASSLGVGAVRKTTLTPRALRYATFLAGSVGAMVIDDPASGHDEGAWLGYTAFDPRPVVAEIAQTRTAMAEGLRTHADTPWTYLFMSQTRPIGSFSTTPRAGSVLIQVGPSEPWSPGLRLSVAQQLARFWIGGETRVAGGGADGMWFSEGVARWYATRALGHAGLLAPNDVRDAVTGEIGVLATLPKEAPKALASIGTVDDVERAHDVARGALYAAYESAKIRAHTKGQRGLEATIAQLVARAEDDKKRDFTTDDWLKLLSADDPDAAATFHALVQGDAPIALPPGALGPCFRAAAGTYTAFDPGFDVETARVSADAKATQVREGGPAAKAGLKEGDVIESLAMRDGDADVPVKIIVTRGDAHVTITYAPRGRTGRGQTWTRVPGVPDEKCGDVL